MAKMESISNEVEIIDRLSEKLKNLGYSVTKDAKVEGHSGAEHSFEIVAFKDNNFTSYRIAIGVAISSKGNVGLNSIFNFDEMAYDSGISYKAFVAIPKLSTMPANFARRQRIRVLDEKGLESFLTVPIPPLPKEYVKIDISGRAKFIESLITNGYSVMEEANVKGTSGIEYTFDILASIDDGIVNHQICIDIISADNEVSLEQVSSFDTKAYDAGIQFKMLIVSPKLSEQAEKLVKKQRIQILEVDKITIEKLMIQKPSAGEETVAQPQKETAVVIVESEATDVQVEEQKAEDVAEETAVPAPVPEESVAEPAVSDAKPVLTTPTLQKPSPQIGRANTLIRASTPQALLIIPEDMARKYTVIPLSVVDNTLQIAMVNPHDILTIEDIEVRTKKRIAPVKALENDIKEAIDYNYKSPGEIKRQLGQTTPQPQVVTRERIDYRESDATPSLKFLNTLVEEAMKARATDIHIEPEDDKLRVRYRVDGILNEVLSLPLNSYGEVTSKIKASANMNIADSKRPQQGQFTMHVKGKDIDIRVSTIGTVKGETITLKIIDKSLTPLSLSELGLQPESRDKLELMLKAPYGMILVSGPSGSGTTTTLKALINSLDKKARNIVTIEDPVEYHLEGIKQIQINPKAGLTFASMLSAVTSQDADVVMVSEIKDSETAKIAAQAALTGQLILGVVHANDSVGVLFRLIEFGVEPFLLSSTVLGTVAQRMIRRVCQHCARKMTAPSAEQTAFHRETGEKCSEFNYGAGCKVCAQSGYLGQTSIFEVLAVTDEIRRLLTSGASASEVRSKAIEEGMITLAKDGMLKARNGITTPYEVLRNVYWVNKGQT